MSSSSPLCVCFQSMGMNSQGHTNMGGPNISSLVGGQAVGAGGMGPGSSPGGMTPGMQNAQMVMYQGCAAFFCYSFPIRQVSFLLELTKFYCRLCCGIFAVTGKMA